MSVSIFFFFSSCIIGALCEGTLLLIFYYFFFLFLLTSHFIAVYCKIECIYNPVKTLSLSNNVNKLASIRIDPGPLRTSSKNRRIDTYNIHTGILMRGNIHRIHFSPIKSRIITTIKGIIGHCAFYFTGTIWKKLISY